MLMACGCAVPVRCGVVQQSLNQGFFKINTVCSACGGRGNNTQQHNSPSSIHRSVGTVDCLAAGYGLVLTCALVCVCGVCGVLVGVQVEFILLVPRVRVMVR